MEKWQGIMEENEKIETRKIKEVNEWAAYINETYWKRRILYEEIRKRFGLKVLNEGHNNEAGDNGMDNGDSDSEGWITINEDSKDCVICIDRLKNVVFIDGCRHLEICNKCESDMDLKHCPRCNCKYSKIKLIDC